MTTTTERATDWALIQQYIEKCGAFIDPFLFNELRHRGLVWAVDRLPDRASVAERKAAAYGRLLKAGKVYGEEQIDGVAAHMERVKTLQAQIAATDPTDTATLVKHAAELTFQAQAVSEFFRS